MGYLQTMCSRYTLTLTGEQLRERYDADPTDAFKPTYNAAPTHLLPVITNEDQKGLSFFYWGVVPKMANNRTISPKLFNARADQLATKASYRNALRSRRCIIPADGYYDWKRVSKKGKTPYWIFMKDKAPFSFAGLWDEYDDEDGVTHHTFRIVTVDSNHILDETADQMPAILTKGKESVWLDEGTSFEDLLSQLVTLPIDQMETHSVSPKVNNQSVDIPDLIKHIPPADQFGNYTLFN